MAKDIIQTAQDLYKRDKDAWADIYRKGKDDLKFLSDADHAQWDEVDAKTRLDAGRPAITVDQLGQFVHQVANDVKMNTPTINVIPSDEAGTVETAAFYKGKIKDIEYRSGADEAYDTSVMSSIKGSIGFIRVDHDYADDVKNIQELFIRRVVNPFAITIDCNSTEIDGSDAMHGHIIERTTVDKFKKRFPGKEPVSFEDEKGKSLTKGDDEIAICEFYKIEEDSRDVGYLDGSEPEDIQEGVEYKATRTLKKRKVMRYTLSGDGVLEKTTFPGKYIPLVPVYGEEAWEDGKRCVHSLIRKSKGAQKLFNFQLSNETEALMKQPEAPFTAAAGSIENYIEDWQNPKKASVLRYDHEIDGRPVPPPQRLMPPQISQGFMAARASSVDLIKGSMGIYNASLGERSNETSGVAINQRKVEGDVATYHFGDNLIKSIQHVGRILVCAIPEIYDTPRLVRIVSDEDEPKTVGINGMIAEGQEQTIDVTQGKYDVRVVTGASFTTQRQETVAALTQMFSANPELMPVFGDIFFKNSDFAGSQAMAKRAEKLVPPNLKDDQDEDQEKMQLQQALAQAQQEIQGMAEQLKARQENEQLKAQVETTKANSELERAKIDAAVKMEELKIKMVELQLKQQENQLKAMEIEARKAEALRPPEVPQSGGSIN